MVQQSISCLRVTHLHCRYGKRIVLDDVTLPDLHASTVVALVGPNGSGKSSLLRSIAGLVPSQADRLHAGAANLAALSAAARAPHLRYLPQSPPPALRLTVTECMKVGSRSANGNSAAQERDARITAQLAELGIEHLAHEWLDTLSGGQRQLVGLAQFLLDSPDVMLLDEPLAALDISFQHLVMQRLRHRVRTRPALAVVVMHDLNMALQYADTVLVLHRGALAGSGTARDVLTPALLKSVFGVRGRLVQSPESRHPVLLADTLPHTEPEPHHPQPASKNNA